MNNNFLQDLENNSIPVSSPFEEFDPEYPNFPDELEREEQIDFSGKGTPMDWFLMYKSLGIDIIGVLKNAQLRRKLLDDLTFYSNNVDRLVNQVELSSEAEKDFLRGEFQMGSYKAFLGGSLGKIALQQHELLYVISLMNKQGRTMNYCPSGRVKIGTMEVNLFDPEVLEHLCLEHSVDRSVERFYERRVIDILVRWITSKKLVISSVPLLLRNKYLSKSFATLLSEVMRLKIKPDASVSILALVQKFVTSKEKILNYGEEGVAPMLVHDHETMVIEADMQLSNLLNFFSGLSLIGPNEVSASSNIREMLNLIINSIMGEREFLSNESGVGSEYLRTSTANPDLFTAANDYDVNLPAVFNVSLFKSSREDVGYMKGLASFITKLVNSFYRLNPYRNVFLIFSLAQILAISTGNFIKMKHFSFLDYTTGYVLVAVGPQQETYWGKTFREGDSPRIFSRQFRDEIVEAYFSHKTETLGNLDQALGGNIAALGRISAGELFYPIEVNELDIHETVVEHCNDPLEDFMDNEGNFYGFDGLNDTNDREAAVEAPIDGGQENAENPGESWLC
jgi:hypothetical protein